MTQVFKILQLGLKAGTSGFNSFGEARRVALQLPRVMDDLKKMGVVWRSSVPLQDRSVNYVILHIPEEVLKELKRQEKNLSGPASKALDEARLFFKGNTAYVAETRQEQLI